MEEPVLAYRISWVSGGIILGIAVLADLVQFFLALTVVFSFVSDIVAVVAGAIIWLFLLASGVSFMRGKKSFGRLGGFLVTAVIELIPILDALPTLSLDTWYNIVSSRSEDRLAFKEQQEQYAQEMASQVSQDEELVRAYYLQAANDNEAEEYREAA